MKELVGSRVMTVGISKRREIVTLLSAAITLLVRGRVDFKMESLSPILTQDYCELVRQSESETDAP